MRRWWLLLIVFTVLLAGCGAAAPAATSTPPYSGDLRGAVFEPPRALDDFSLMSTTGEPFTLSEHRGEAILIYFGYRACPDFCPTTFAELRRIYDELGNPADQLKVLFVTVDPERDQLADLSLYTHAFHDDFIGVRAEGEPLQALMGQFGVVAQRRQVGESALSYMVDHTASLFLIDPDGRLAVQYLYGTDYRSILHDLRLILPSV